LDGKGKALVLFLAGTGSRVGEALRLKVDDLRLDEDPPPDLDRARYGDGTPGRYDV